VFGLQAVSLAWYVVNRTRLRQAEAAFGRTR
jgi:hypothetical protein